MEGSWLSSEALAWHSAWYVAFPQKGFWSTDVVSDPSLPEALESWSM